jgi:hypothetical protein
MLAMQSHRGIIYACDCVAKTSSPQLMAETNKLQSSKEQRFHDKISAIIGGSDPMQQVRIILANQGLLSLSQDTPGMPSNSSPVGGICWHLQMQMRHYQKNCQF